MSATPTRKQRRADARAEREAAERAARLAHVRRRRVQALAAIALTAAVVVAVALLVSGGSKDKTPGTAIHSAAQVNRELAGVAQANRTLGRAGAPVTITEYGDLQCPVCQQLATTTLSEFIKRDVRSGRARLTFANLLTATGDSKQFRDEAIAALAAGRQGRLWNYVLLFYRNQREEGTGYATDAFLTSLARKIPDLDVGRWQRDRKDPALAREVQADASTADRNGFDSTPTLVVQARGRKPRAASGVPTYAQLQSLLRAAEQ